jgi:hypothetical protein
MRRVFCLPCGGLVSCLVLLATALVQAEAPRVEVETRREAAGSSRVPKATILIGAPVSIRDHHSIGKVEDLVLNDNGCVEYLVVWNDAKYVLVPWSAARIDFGQRTVAIEIEREKFREVPTFTRDRWPDLSDAGYVERIHTHYGVKPPARERKIERKEEKKGERKENRRP